MSNPLQFYLYQTRLPTIFHVPMLYVVILYGTFYVLCFIQSFYVNSYKARMFTLLDTSSLFNSKFYFFNSILSEIVIELSYDFWISEKQLEIIHSHIQYTAIGWIWETLTCPNIYSFMLFNACQQVKRGLTNLHRLIHCP